MSSKTPKGHLSAPENKSNTGQPNTGAVVRLPHWKNFPFRLSMQNAGEVELQDLNLIHVRTRSFSYPR